MGPASAWVKLMNRVKWLKVQIQVNTVIKCLERRSVPTHLRLRSQSGGGSARRVIRELLSIKLLFYWLSNQPWDGSRKIYLS